MTDECGRCRRSHQQLISQDTKLKTAEKELSSCQDYLRRYTIKRDGETQKLQESYNTLRQQLEEVNENYTALSQKYDEKVNAVYAAELKRQEYSKIIEAHVFSESSYVRRIAELEKENAALKLFRPTIPSDYEATMEMLVKRVQLLENAQKNNESSFPVVQKSPPTLKNDEMIQQKLIEIENIQNAFNEYDPVEKAGNLLKKLLATTDKHEEIAKTKSVIESYQKDLSKYKEVIATNLFLLTQTDVSSLSDLEPMYDIPDPISIELLSDFETSLKQKLMSQEKCLICKQNIELKQKIAPCDECKQLYHKECGSIFAEKALSCFTPGCTKKFESFI